MYICDNNNEIPSYFTERNWSGSPSFSQKKEQKIEILAPASADSYKNAVYNGADAIYFGYKELNARAKGANFASIKEVTQFCHLFGVKAYLALNISIKNNELEMAKEIIIEAEDAKIDAFIISDLAILPLIKKYSKAQVHASTQMGIHNVYGAKFLEKLGFDRVVLSREVSLDEIRRIKENCKIEIEVFVHGALCVGFSGACLISSILTGNSGNRGRCSQLCRHYYNCFVDGKKITEGYLLSAKDVNMLDNLAKLKEVKVDSFKIEGRLRRPEYVGGTTNIYQYYTTSNDNPSASDENTLKLLYNRGNYTTLYLDDKDKIYPHIPSHIGVPFGKIVEVRSANTAVAKMDYEAESGDGFKIIRDKAEISGAVVKADIGNYKYLIHTDNQVGIGDIALLTTSKTLNDSINEITKKITIDAGIRLVQGEKPHIIASANGFTVEIFGQEIIPAAKSRAIAQDEVKEQFSKTNDTYFEFKFVSVFCEDAFLTKSQINNLRRETIDKVQSTIINCYQRKNKVWQKFDKTKDLVQVQGDFAEFSETFPDIVYDNVKNIVYNPDDLTYENCLKFYEKAKRQDNLIFIKPPIFVLEKNFTNLEKICEIFDGIVADNLSFVELGKSLGKLIVAGYSLNITNSKNLLINITNQHFASVELNKKELIPFKGALLYTYGNLPLMHLNHCPHLQAGQKCGNCDGKMLYKDKKGQYEITTKKFLGYCQHVLKNGIVTNLGNIDGYYKYFDFTSLEKTEIENILYQYYIIKNFSTENYNHLHLTRGVN